MRRITWARGKTYEYAYVEAFPLEGGLASEEAHGLLMLQIEGRLLHMIVLLDRNPGDIHIYIMQRYCTRG